MAVNRTCTETAIVSRGTIAMQQPKSVISRLHHFRGYKKYAQQKGYSHSLRITCDRCAVSLLESRE